MNTYKCSDGTRVTQAQVDRRIKQAKAKKLQQAIEEKGYIACEECHRNDCKPVDCSHTISVKEAKETGRTELCWDYENNIKLRGRPCHAKYDGLAPQWTSELEQN
ncbi:MAG TPA: hypothetical protein VFM70_04440 [Salinimicrobium sp.]|nr:hypothetical protein [Salinimicrobium sp.]